MTVLAVLMAAGAVAQTAATDTQTTPPPPVRDSALVKAAKKAGTAPKMPKKVITNKDVKKSKGKLAVATPPPIPAVAATATPADTRTPTQVSDENYRDRKAANERAKVAEKRVDELQKDLAAIEQAYYAEKDLNLRDDAIQKRFAQTKRQLEAARKELADARDATAPAIPKP